MSHYFYITPEEYQTAAKNGVSAILLTKRVRVCAWSIDRATTTPPQRGKWADWIALAAKNGISVGTFRTRIFRGMEPSQAATDPVLSRVEIIESRVRVWVYPKFYADLAKENGIKPKTYAARVCRGWEPADAATRPTMTSREIGLQRKERRKKWETTRPQKLSPLSRSLYVNN